MEAGANATSRLVLVPKVAGVMTVGRAEVKYKWLPRDELELESEDGDGKRGAAFEESAEDQLSFSSSQGKIDILTPEGYARLTRQKLPTALACTGGALAAVALPYLLYAVEQSK